MPTWKENLEEFYRRAGKASDIARQLALAGIAVVWFFSERDQISGSLALNNILGIAGFFFVLSLATDLIYALADSAILGVYLWKLDKEGVEENHEIAFPRRYIRLSCYLWSAKFALLGIGYCFTLFFLLRNVF